MKLFVQLTLLAAFVACATAQVRDAVNGAKPDVAPGHRQMKSFAFSDDAGGANAKGELGCRKECADKRFTMVCRWEAEKKDRKRQRKLGEGGLDFEDEDNENAVAAPPKYRQLDVGGGRRLKVALKGVECILGVGKKDSDDSDEDYEEYKERLGFPDDAWELKIKEAEFEEPLPGQGGDGDHDGYGYYDKPDIETATIEAAPYYKFSRAVEFEDIEDPNNSADEITITGSIEIELLCREIDGVEYLEYDDAGIGFSC